MGEQARIAVIGAGWAGIAAAVTCADAGAAVTLFEAGRGAGGRARSVNIAGRTLDNGQHILLGAYHETLALMRQVGADPQRMFSRRPLCLLEGDTFQLRLPNLPAPLHLAAGLLGAHGVSWREKIRTALWMQGIKWRKFRLDQTQSVAEWLDAAGQTGALRRHLWEPLCLAALNTAPEQACAQLFAHVLRDSLGSPQREATDLLLPRVPFGELLPEPALAWLAQRGADLRLGQRVRQLAGTRIDDEDFSAVIVAVAPHHLSRLLPAVPDTFSYEPIATVYLDYGAQTVLPFPLRHLGAGTAAWAVDRGQGMIGCAISGHGDWETLADNALAARMADALGLGAPHWQQVIREKRATFSARPGLRRPDYRTDHPCVFLAGDYTWADYPATLEGAVRSGRRAAFAAIQASKRPA
ncbi:hydroxysqualene dehydroxylase HpnE [Azonexus hydrophilus]|uniref:hydroxysqualene dehydroxylase HpnE n=1 Tax=Azonexus hydrophilus TaxID=418702 RepID=UPI0019624DF2|nr:hydroxysqualene dehydroxylase HpnE [Azonexus hydrophilus]